MNRAMIVDGNVRILRPESKKSKIPKVQRLAIIAVESEQLPSNHVAGKADSRNKRPIIG
jgi:hypothetical protein